LTGGAPSGMTTIGASGDIGVELGAVEGDGPERDEPDLGAQSEHLDEQVLQGRRGGGGGSGSSSGSRAPRWPRANREPRPRHSAARAPDSRSRPSRRHRRAAWVSSSGDTAGRLWPRCSRRRSGRGRGGPRPPRRQSVPRGPQAATRRATAAARSTGLGRSAGRSSPRRRGGRARCPLLYQLHLEELLAGSGRRHLTILASHHAFREHRDHLNALVRRAFQRLFRAAGLVRF